MFEVTRSFSLLIARSVSFPLNQGLQSSASGEINKALLKHLIKGVRLLKMASHWQNFLEICGAGCRKQVIIQMGSGICLVAQ